MGFGNCQPTRVPLLNARHRAREHREWSVEDWKRVAWSDESRFRLLNVNGRSWSGVFFRGTVWDLWCVYQSPSMQFGT
ncbi:uncharacterized protein TNCV_1054631 [Trichonephila clavipes]|nr:uncharacterized protein TNCV_1054631 [Trichonephila clavipes]